jgi:hypothetical protein
MSRRDLAVRVIAEERLNDRLLMAPAFFITTAALSGVVVGVASDSGEYGPDAVVASLTRPARRWSWSRFVRDPAVLDYKRLACRSSALRIQR